jgi:hypothetical protein
MPTDAEQSKTGIYRGENFESLYANNVQFQPFEWDLKVIFGELDVLPDKPNELVVEQHTAITIPWLQAKLAVYYLSLQVAVHEMTHERIRIPTALIPPEPTRPTGDMADDPTAIKVYEHIKATRERFLAASSLLGDLA